MSALLRRSIRDTVLFLFWFLVFFSALGYLSQWVPVLYSFVAFCYLTALQLVVVVFGNLLPDVPSMAWSYLMWIVVPIAYTVLFGFARLLYLLIWPFRVESSSQEHQTVVHQKEVV
ncbi:MAG: hypothetical protein EOP84_20940 [Verrucomicrobiaceae bacterium]|nr:MAG: hypothetical protein EOP84_20940 [Verrucomicrobiaceae bacterium]